MLDALKLQHTMTRVAAAPAVAADAPLPVRAPGPITLADDGFHFAEYASHPGRFWYVEWWYLNFVDPAQGISGMATLAVFNPGDELHVGVGSLNAVFFPPGAAAPLTEMDYLPLHAFRAAADRPDVTLGGSSLRALDADTLHLECATEDGKLAFDLTFAQRDQPRLLASDVPGAKSWEVSSWLAYLPCAAVTGTITADGATYRLDAARGYHDHDWGMWEVPFNTWSWAEFADPVRQLSLDVGFHAAFQVSTAYFRAGDLRLTFPQENLISTQSDWQAWEHLWKYPTVTTLQAVDSTGDYRLDLTWTARRTSVLWKYPLIVFEQSAHFTGALARRSGDSWTPMLDIAQDGFCEYTDRWIGAGG